MEPIGYHAFNLGDVAMRRAAVERLRAVFPCARIEIFADDPAVVSALVPGATVLSTAARRRWFYSPAVGRVRALLPHRAYGAALRGERWARRRVPDAVARVEAGARRLLGRQGSPTGDLVSLVRRADLVLVSGGGAFNDHFAASVTSVLDVAEIALAAGIPVAMMGQSFGPLTDPRLLTRLRRILPRLILVGLREDVASGPLLAGLGVPSDIVVTTGDDALELARRNGGGGEGSRLGLNVRVAGYAALDAPRLDAVAGGLAAARYGHGREVQPLGVSRHPGERDEEVSRRVATAAGLRVAASGGATTPSELAALVAGCRVVVTGSYHAAVFALARGIPAVGLVGSPYYAQKFAGLSALFPGGCVAVEVDPRRCRDTLAGALDAMWERAPAVRAALLEAGDRQVAASRAAYRLLGDRASAVRPALTGAARP